MWINREISPKLKRLCESFPAILLTGARQTGKTSLLKRLFPNHSYVSLDLRMLAEQAEESPRTFLREYPPPVIIDEVQYAPELFRYLKIAIDEDRQAKGQFILTGSHKFELMKEVSDSLAGRCVVLSLPGLTVAEARSSNWGAEFEDEFLTRGSFPELWAEPNIIPREFYQSYLSTYLERDLRQVLRVGSLRDFERFVRACAARSSQLLNRSQLARDVGISQTTATEWISALQASNQLTLLEPFFANVGKRLVKSPKLYFNDTGLLCFLLGLTRDSLNSSPLRGAVWENFVMIELSKHLELNHPEWTLWFYRDQQNREVDFLIQGPYERIRLLDAKWAEMPNMSSFAALERVAEILQCNSSLTKMYVGIVSRTKGIHRVKESRSLVSAYEIPRYLSGTSHELNSGES